MRKVKAAAQDGGKCISFLLTTIIAHKLLMPQSSSPTPPLLSLSNSPHQVTADRAQDTQLVKVGDETTIDYGYRYRVYIRQIREGLHHKKAWAIGLLAYWDRILFPNADKSRVHDAAGNQELDDDKDLDDIFGQALSAAERTIPQVSPALHRTTAKTTSKAGHPPLPLPTPAFAPLIDKLTATIIQLPALIIGSTIKPTVHHLPDADHSSSCLGCEAPTCTTHGSKQAILIPTECSPELLS
ncbi:hypothetical protein B0H13DRAFT_1892980 [Mycena leptocephala]|nr:hypothetical protein B0H13DRAFT_1892980 [Mycena leptocephala]